MVSPKSIVKAVVLSAMGYVALRFWEQVEALILSLTGSSPLPSETMLLGLIGIASIAFAVVLLISSSRGLRSFLTSLLFPPSFEGEIFGENENKFLVGGTLGFKAEYRGLLNNGYFTTKVRPQELDTILDTGRDYEWLVDYNTNRGKIDGKETGRLNGFGSGWPRKSHKSAWGHKIPFKYPAGKYTVTLMVFDDRDHDKPIATVPLSFTVLDEKLAPLRGWTKDGQLIPPPRSMFVKDPRRRSWLGTLK